MAVITHDLPIIKLDQAMIANHLSTIVYDLFMIGFDFTMIANIQSGR